MSDGDDETDAAAATVVVKAPHRDNDHARRSDRNEQWRALR